MNIEIQPADLRLRRVTTIVLSVATLAALCAVYAFHRWIAQSGATVSNAQLVTQLRLWVGISLTGIGLCLLLLAGYAARLARSTFEQRRWPPMSMRVLHDTPIRRDERASSIGRLLNLAAMVLIVLAIAAALLSWKLFNTGH